MLKCRVPALHGSQPVAKGPWEHASWQRSSRILADVTGKADAARQDIAKLQEQLQAAREAVTQGEAAGTDQEPQQTDNLAALRANRRQLGLQLKEARDKVGETFPIVSAFAELSSVISAGWTSWVCCLRMSCRVKAN